jgi:hypothetical protein
MASEVIGAKQRSVAAILFLTATMNTLDAYSALNSSPWTAESFGGDPAKLASLRGYVSHAIVFSMAYAVAASLIAGSLWPISGAATANAYLWWLYDRAAGRAQEKGSTTWS